MWVCLIFFICPSVTLLIIFYYVMNLWRLSRPDFIPLALLASEFYLSLASGGQKKWLNQWRKRFVD